MRILICIRQLPYSESTILFASQVARSQGASITLLNIADHEADVPSARAFLEEARLLLGEFPVKIKVRLGKTLEEIMLESQENDYDLIVVGAHLVTGILDGLLGTLTGKVADKSKKSVLIVRPGKPDITRIMIPVGSQKLNRNLVQTGADLAIELGARVTLLYVASPVPSMYTGLEGIEETLEELLQTDTPIARHLRWSALYLAEEGVDSELQIRHGVVSDEIIREAVMGAYDLIVIGAVDVEGPFRRLFMDKVTPQVVDRAPCSVLVVKQDPSAERE